jgi:4a-hydroxytetrahydrobiopterin dehydratase
MKNQIRPQPGQLIKEKCTACRADSPAVSDEEVKILLPVVMDWKLIEENGTKKLDRSFRFSTFKDAMAFTSKIASLAEDEGHHPRIVTEWGAVRVTWWTHKIRNLHRNDFLMAIKSTDIFNNL